MGKFNIVLEGESLIHGKVSVCVVTYNHSNCIYDCLMSVIAQSGDMLLELLVGDDLSQDNTGEIVQQIAKKYPGLVRYFRHSKNKGPAGNYQFLIRETQGEYIAHLDGDDYWLPGKLEAQVRLLDKHTECPAVYANALVVDSSGLAKGVFNNRLPHRFSINALLRGGNFLNHSSVMYRSIYRDSILNFKQPFIDYRIHLCLSLRGDIAYLNQILLAYRVSSNTSMLIHSNDHVREMYWETLHDIPEDRVDSNDLGRCRAEFMRSVIFRSIRIRSFSLVKKWWPQVIDTSPWSSGVMIFWVLYAVLRVGFFEAIGYICSLFSGSHMKVYFRR